MNALCLASPVKINGTVHDAVVSDGTGGLAQLLEPARQVTDAAGTVQKAILCMYMKMYE